ncbi:MAG: hypothetical protein ACK5PW_01825 [Burkholderiales bacterium]|jgi:hypothetical protein
MIRTVPALRIISQTGRAGTHVDATDCEARGIRLVAGTDEAYFGQAFDNLLAAAAAG